MTNHPDAPRERDVVTQSNKLIEARYRLGLVEQRLIAVLASRIHPADEDFKPYTFSVQELQELTGGGGKAMHARLPETTRKLMTRVLQIKKPDGGLLQVNWLSSAEYTDGNVELCFDPKLMPYLLRLQESFTTYRLGHVVKLKSTYSVRLYELLKQYESLGERTIELPDLRALLGFEAGEYKRWVDIKRYVLEPAHKELPEKTDLSFNYKTRKRGRAVHFIDFEIGRKAKALKGEVAIHKKEAAKCYTANPGCTVAWSGHNEPPTSIQAASCHWCPRFTAQRAELQGQQALPLA